MAGLETCWDFFLEKSFKPAKNLQNRFGLFISAEYKRSQNAHNRNFTCR